MLKQDQTEQQTVTSGSSFFSDEPVLKVKPPTTGGGDPNPSSPVAEGGIILGLLACIYGVAKKRRKE